MVPVPGVYRGMAEFPNIKAVVMSVEQYGLYKIGTKHGVLQRMYVRNQFAPCTEKFLNVEDVTANEVSVREVARLDSLGTGQGYVKRPVKVAVARV